MSSHRFSFACHEQIRCLWFLWSTTRVIAESHLASSERLAIHESPVEAMLDEELKTSTIWAESINLITTNLVQHLDECPANMIVPIAFKSPAVSDILEYSEVSVRNTLLNSGVLQPLKIGIRSHQSFYSSSGTGHCSYHIVGGQSEMEPSYAHLSCACRISQLELR